MFTKRTGDPALAADLAQRTWAALWDILASGRYDPARASLSTLTYAIALNIWRSHARARPGPALGLAEADALLGPGTDPSDSLEQAENLQRVRSALDGSAGLSADEAHVLRLLASGVSDRGLAQHLGCSPSTAHARKRAALDRLRQHLTGSGELPRNSTRPSAQSSAGNTGPETPR